jgi:hypothetical protein
MGKRQKNVRANVGEVIVGPVTFDVIEVRDLRNEEGQMLYGHAVHTCDELRINAGLKSSRRSTVLMHETLHAVDEVYQIGLSEKQVHRLAVGLMNLKRDNPDFFKGES